MILWKTRYMKKIEIRNQILKCDNELTILAEKLFKEYYLEGKNDAKKE